MGHRRPGRAPEIAAELNHIMKRKPHLQDRASAIEMLLLRDRLGYKRYWKTARRDPQERELLLALALKKIAKAEKDNYTLVGPRKRRFRSRAA